MRTQLRFEEGTGYLGVSAVNVENKIVVEMGDTENDYFQTIEFNKQDIIDILKWLNDQINFME